ncbi:hypothetical protein R3X27_09515 [Tropicimonas sp. TH_r6]|nr:hypothetical protein [Tropicimonas sp. TH_r6]MDV7142923.1 hypothetical protein [Tropicimonas sp. TH_r6]
MEWIAQITIGDLILSFMACCLIHEMLIAVLPDEVAGPGGWLIDTGTDE